MNKQEYIDIAEQELLHTYNRFSLVLDHGEGVHLYDTDGKEYLDFAAGIAVCALGYSNEEYKNGLKDQIDKLIHHIQILHMLFLIFLYIQQCCCSFQKNILQTKGHYNSCPAIHS